MVLFDPDQSSSLCAGMAVAGPSKSLAGRDKHMATALPTYGW
jgi:hypothetical protein